MASIDPPDPLQLEPITAAISKIQREPPFTYRVRGIPIKYDVKGLEELLRSVLGLQPNAQVGENSDIEIGSLAISPDHKSKTATVDFDTPPTCLSLGRSGRDEWSFRIPPTETNAQNHDRDDDEDFIPRRPTITIDSHFKGITTLKSFKNPSEHKLDCIAITGLGGHAFESFKERGGSHMWLRDSLRYDLPGARIMLYGYDAKVSGSNSFQDLEALATTLRSQLQILAIWKTTESHTIPLIFIAHSLGGIIVKEAIIQLKRAQLMHDPNHQGILSSIYGALFFGVPNQGMEIASLIAMVKDQPNQGLIYSLGKDSQLLREQCRYFPEAFNSRESKIVCFYETKKSPTAEHDGIRWQMTGPPNILVDVSSATHGRHWEKEAHHVQGFERTHSDLVKFSEHDDDYEIVRAVLKSMASEIAFSEAMKKGERYLGCHDKNTLGDNRSSAEKHFLKALEILNTHADPADFVKVYNGLMHVHLDLTFKSGLSIDQREEHLRTAIDYNGKSYEMAQKLQGDTWALAEAKLQDAVLYGRRVLLRAKRGGDVRGVELYQMRDKAVEMIEQALGGLRTSNHRSKEKSIAWGKDWQDRLKNL